MRGPARMKILHILDHSLPIHSGYTFRTRAILKAQIAMGWEVLAVTGPRYNAASPDPAEEEGLRFFRTPPTRRQRAPIGELREVRALAARVAEVAADWRPDILHAHSPS